MTQDELAVLMGWASGVDQYFPAADSDVLDGWYALLADVPREVAAEAMRAHYRTTKETITPADISFVWREKRRHQQLGEMGPEQRPGVRQSDDEIHAGVDRVMAMWTARRALKSGEDPEMAVAIAEGETAVRREYRSRPCPFCRAGVNEPCTNGRGERLTKSPAHPARMTAAQVEARGSKPVSFRT